MAPQPGPFASKASKKSQSDQPGQKAIVLWEKWFEKRPISSDPGIAKLDVECIELAQTWKRFQENLPSSDQVEFQERLQQSDDVLAVVHDVQTVCMSHPRQQIFSRSMALCDQFISSLSLHLVLSSILPGNQAYLALFYGILQSVIKASAGYPRVMEGLIAILVQVNESARLAVGEPNLASNKESIVPIANFYALIFLLLGEFMSWYVRAAKCRLLKSPSLDPYPDFEYLLRCIQTCARDITLGLAHGIDLDTYGKEIGKIFHEPDLSFWMQARLSKVGLQKWKRRLASQNAVTRQLIWGIQHDASERARMRVERDVLLAKLLDAVGPKLRLVNGQSAIAYLTTTTGDLDGSRFNWSKGPKRKYTRLDLQLATTGLQDFFNPGDQVANFYPGMDVVVEHTVVKPLQQWASQSHSQILVVSGLPTTAFPSPVAMFSACVASFARQARLPVVSHFCSTPAKVAEGMTEFQQGLIALAYSVIRQLMDYIPPVVESHEQCELTAERFEFFNGTLSAWKRVLSVIDALLHYAPPLLVFVIDGLDVLHDESTDLYLRSLVRVLMGHVKHRAVTMPDGTTGQKVLLKVLFTVAGRPCSLFETLSEDQPILSGSNGTGQAGRGLENNEDMKPMRHDDHDVEMTLG